MLHIASLIIGAQLNGSCCFLLQGKTFAHRAITGEWHAYTSKQKWNKLSHGCRKPKKTSNASNTLTAFIYTSWNFWESIHFKYSLLSQAIHPFERQAPWSGTRNQHYGCIPSRRGSLSPLISWSAGNTGLSQEVLLPNLSWGERGDSFISTGERLSEEPETWSSRGGTKICRWRASPPLPLSTPWSTTEPNVWVVFYESDRSSI